tara:strand:+ start:530 stop:934 length:405 start_codon:yes stop_codon:yes gene_type:complete
MELAKDTTADDLRRMCRSILNDVCDGIEITAENIEEWAVHDIPDMVQVGDYLPTHEWISRNVYSERYLIDSDGELIEVQLMVAGGGPSIWVHCLANSVEVHGYWGGDHVRVDALVEDGMGIWDYYNEMTRFKRV